MASNNLTVDQIAAPDFSGIAQLMTGAGASFNNAFDAANDILGKYQTGQQAKADAGYLNALGNIKSEAELTDFFAKNPLAKANLSPDMMKTMLGMRNQVLGYESSRAQTDNTNATAANTRATTSINLAGEKRNLYDWQDKIAALNAGRAAQPAITGAYIAGQQYGQPAGGGPSIPNTAEAGNIVAGLVARGVPEHVAQGVVLNAQDESGLNPGAIGDNGNAGGLLQWNGARFKGLQAFARDQGKPWQDTEVQLDYFMHENKNGEKANWDKIVASGSSGEAAVNFVNLWERPAEEHRARRAAAYAGVTGGATPGPNGFTGGAQNGYLASPEIQAGLQAIQSNKYLTAAEAQAQVDALIGGAAAGQKTISERDAATQQLLADQAKLGAITNPNNTTQAGIQTQVAGTANLNPSTALAAAVDVGQLAGPGGGLNPVALPAPIVDPAVALSAAAAQDRNTNNLATDPANLALRNLEEVKKSDDPLKMVADTYNETRSVFSADSSFDSPRLREAAQQMADEARVSLPELATTLLEMSTAGKDSIGPRTSPDAYVQRFINGTLDNYGDNPLEVAKQKFGPGSKYKSNVAETAAASSNSRIGAVQAQIDTLSIQKQKMPVGDPRRTALDTRINALTRELNQIGSAAQESKAKLEVMPVGSPQYQEELVRFGKAIDEDQSLSAAEKASLKAQWGAP